MVQTAKCHFWVQRQQWWWCKGQRVDSARVCCDSTKAFKCQLWDLQARAKWQASFIRESPYPNQHYHWCLYHCHFATAAADQMSKKCLKNVSEMTYMIVILSHHAFACFARSKNKEGLVLACPGNQGPINFAKIGNGKKTSNHNQYIHIDDMSWPAQEQNDVIATQSRACRVFLKNNFFNKKKLRRLSLSLF